VAFEGEPRRILARISGRAPLRLFPDAFMADPAVPPAEVAGLLGYQSEVHELFELTAVTLGYYEASAGFVNPRIPPYSGAPIYIASDEMLAGVLSRKRPGELGAAHIGSLLSRERDAVPIALEVRRFTSTHLAIIASTGSGKSYLAAAIVEELMMPNNRASVLIIDPHGEYDTLAEMQGLPEFTAAGYTPRVKIVRPADIHVRVST
jgi:DNA helicase HerA-like ATPase